MRAPRLENMLWRSQMEKQGQAVWEPWTDESLPNRSDQIGHIPALVHSPILGSSSEPLPGVEPVALNPELGTARSAFMQIPLLRPLRAEA